MLAGFLLLTLGTIPWQQHARSRANEASLQLVPLRPNTSDVSLHLVRQPLDHYDATDTRSWTQRVFVRRAFFDGTGPVFVCLAAVVGALLVAVEHRYFGPSADVRPLPSFDTESLRTTNVVASALANTAVGGSANCAAAVRDGHAELLLALRTEEGRRDLEASFNLCDKGALDTRTLALAWAGGGAIFTTASTFSSSTTAAYPSLFRLAELLELQALRRLAAVNAKQRAGACIPTVELDPTIALAELLNTSSPARAWPYQTCAEYGFTQTCEVGLECPFARGALSLSGSFEMCRRAFGISAAEVALHVAMTNARYGGNSPATSRVLFIKGDVDPWSALGVLASPDGNRSEPVCLAAGASYHSWTHPVDSIVQPSVRRAKELVWRYVIQWLHEIDDWAYTNARVEYKTTVGEAGG
ncbi:serine carboxypeptidase S28-domain-containing protein [Pavlovales sp. CCMP2436]|nr:serine carboxypeptidase S28-domain-containing protein [Pavlovales sp. CCMP2436]